MAALLFLIALIALTMFCIMHFWYYGRGDNQQTIKLFSYFKILPGLVRLPSREGLWYMLRCIDMTCAELVNVNESGHVLTINRHPKPSSMCHTLGHAVHFGLPWPNQSTQILLISLPSGDLVENSNRHFQRLLVFFVSALWREVLKNYGQLFWSYKIRT